MCTMMSYNIRQRPDEQAEALEAMHHPPYSKGTPEQHVPYEGVPYEGQPYSVGEGDMPEYDTPADRITAEEWEAIKATVREIHSPPPVLDAFLASPTGKGGF